MAKSELHFLGHIIDLTTVETDYNKLFNTYSGMPVLYNGGGLLRFVFDLGENFRFLERMTTVNYELYKLGYPVDDGKIIFYDANDDILKTWKFKDAPIVYYKVKFDPNGIGMQVEMILSPAIQDYGSKIHRSWDISPINEEPYQSPIHATDQEEETGLKFIASFERLGTYKGEFGFDWMRENYKDICQDYEKLKKEYFPTSIHEEEYFVPSLSMFPNQENVKLKLAIKKKEGTVSDDDIIKLPPKSGIRFEPDEVKVSDADGKQITVICDSPLSSHVKIELLDKNHKKVGVINVIKNNINHNLNIRIIKVVREQSKERDLIGINEALQQVDLENYLNKNSLNQALIKTNIENNDTNVIELDTEQLTKDKKLDGAGFKDKVEQVSSMFLEEYIQKYEQKSTFKGLLVFVTILKKPGSAGDGQLLIGDARNCSVFYDGRYQPTTYAHEIAHVLGCMHPFDEFNNKKIEKVDERIEYYDNEVKKRKNKILEYEEKIKKANKSIIEMRKYPNNLVAIKNIEIHKGNIKSYKESIENRKKNIEKAKEIISQKRERKIQLTHIKNENQYIFTEGSTKENFMDYTIPRSARISFWRWQWKAIQNDIKRYY